MKKSTFRLVVSNPRMDKSQANNVSATIKSVAKENNFKSETSKVQLPIGAYVVDSYITCTGDFIKAVAVRFQNKGYYAVVSGTVNELM